MTTPAQNRLSANIPFEVFHLSEVTNPAVVKTRAQFQEKLVVTNGREIPGCSDWLQIDHVFSLIEKKGQLLNVGVGAGQLFNTLVRSDTFSRIVGVDIQQDSHFIEPEGAYEFLKMSVTNLNLPDNSFDTVVCMGVLEYIEPQFFSRALSELRRVCRGTLIVTVPFEEMPPSTNHKTRFGRKDIVELFPSAHVQLLFKNNEVLLELIIVERSADALKPNIPKSEPHPTEYHDRVSEVYKGELFPKKTQEELRSRIHWMRDKARGPRVLDIGCSQGITAILLAQLGHEVIGVDPDQAVIDYATKDAESHNLSASRLKFVCSTIENCSEDELGKFDSILIGEVIEHFENPKGFISSALRFLKPDGLLVLTTPFGLKPNPDHRSTFTLSSIRTLSEGLFTLNDLEVVDGYIRIIGSEKLAVADDQRENQLVTDKALLLKTEDALLETQAALLNRVNIQRKAQVKASDLNKKLEENKRLLCTQLEDVSTQLEESKGQCSDLMTRLKEEQFESKFSKRMGGKLEKAYSHLLAEQLLAHHELEGLAYQFGTLVIRALKSPLYLFRFPFDFSKFLLMTATQGTKKIGRRYFKLRIPYNQNEFLRRITRLYIQSGARNTSSWIDNAQKLGVVDGSTARRESFKLFRAISQSKAVRISDDIVKRRENFDGFLQNLLELRSQVYCANNEREFDQINKTISEMSLAELGATKKKHISYLITNHLLDDDFFVSPENKIYPYSFPADFSQRLENWARTASKADVNQGLEALQAISRPTHLFLELEIFKAFREVDSEIARLYGDRAMKIKKTPAIARSYSMFLQTQGSLYQVEEIACYLIQKSDKHNYHLQVVRSQLELLQHGFPLPEKQMHGSLYQSSENVSVYYLLHNSLPYASGGYAARTHGILTSIRQLGVNAMALSRLGYPMDREPLDSELKVDPVNIIDEVPYHRLLSNRDKGFGRTPLVPYLKDYCIALERQVREQPVSLLHAASNFMNGICANYVGRKLGIPSIYEVRGLWEITRMSRVPEWEGSDYYNMQVRMERDACLGADRVVTITHALKDELTRRGVPEEKITVIPNGADSSRFVPLERNNILAQTLGIGSDPIIGYVGSIVQYEGLELLLHALSKLQHRGTKFKALIVGDGAVLDSLKSLATELNLNDFIIFTGRVPHHEVEQYYSLIDICPFPRLAQPVCEMVSPLKPFEAMCMEKLVISSDVAALNEIIKHEKTGLIFNKNNIDSLVNTLEQAIDLTKTGHSLGHAAREWVVLKRDWKVLGQKFLELYQEVLSTAKSP